MEREWARKLNAAQLEGLQKLAEMEAFAKAKAAEVDGLQSKAQQLEAAAERICRLEEAREQEKRAGTKALREAEELARVSQVRNGSWSCMCERQNAFWIMTTGQAVATRCFSLSFQGGALAAVVDTVAICHFLNIQYFYLHAKLRLQIRATD